MAPSSSNAWSNLSKFDIEMFEAQLLIVDTGAASLAALQKLHIAEVAKLRHLFSTLLSAPLSSELKHQHSTLQPSLAAVTSGNLVSSHSDSAIRVCNRPGCTQHIPSSDPTRDLYLQDMLKRGEWSPRKTCSSCKSKDKISLAARPRK
jgi:hypothetical protein